jgi:hypothetical protein
MRKTKSMIRAVAKTCRHTERGQSLVEVAFAVPILLLLMVGLIEVGRFAYFAVLVSNASLITANDKTGITSAAQNDGQIPGTTLTVTPTQWCGCRSNALGGCPSAGGCANPLVYVKVVASEDVTSLFHYPGIPPTITLTSTVQMRVAQ